MSRDVGLTRNFARIGHVTEILQWKLVTDKI
jgi:hypothetical protein